MKASRFIIILFFLFIGNQMIFSAPPPPPAGSPGCWPPPCVPIDGGLTFLAVAGAAFGAKKLIDSRKKNKSII